MLPNDVIEANLQSAHALAMQPILNNTSTTKEWANSDEIKQNCLQNLNQRVTYLKMTQH